jgi:hypothetical protein
MERGRGEVIVIGGILQFIEKILVVGRYINPFEKTGSSEPVDFSV